MSEGDQPIHHDETPEQVCAAALASLDDCLNEVADSNGAGLDQIRNKTFVDMWDSDVTGEKLEADLDASYEDEPPIMRQVFHQATLICCAYAIQGMKAYQAGGDVNLAWRYATRCRYWESVVRTMWSLRELLDKPMKRFAQLGAAASHVENHALKQEVFDWLDKHMKEYKSKTAAARSIVKMNLVPVVFSTVLAWISQWEKLQSAGRL